LVEEPEEFINLLFGKVGIVRGVFHFKSIRVKIPSSHYVRQRIEAGVADGNPNGVVALLLQQLHQNGFTIEASFAPATKSHPVNFFTQAAFSPRLLFYLLSEDKNCCLRDTGKWVG